MFLKHLFITSLLVLLRIQLAFAHLGTLTGIVNDARTPSPLRGITVKLVGTGKLALTDELGRYRFDRLTPRLHRIEFSHVGDASIAQETAVGDDQKVHSQTSLVATPVNLSTVTVSALRPADQQLISSTDIRLLAIVNSQEILRLVPGLFTGQHAG